MSELEIGDTHHARRAIDEDPLAGGHCVRNLPFRCAIAPPERRGRAPGAAGASVHLHRRNGLDEGGEVRGARPDAPFLRATLVGGVRLSTGLAAPHYRHDVDSRNTGPRGGALR
jgi:hypothetical protein